MVKNSKMEISDKLEEFIKTYEGTILHSDIMGLLPEIKRLEELERIVSEEMIKPDDESDLCIIGEKVVGYLGYWG
jgi:hypothetical protein